MQQMNITYFLTDLQIFYGQEILAILISIYLFISLLLTTTVKFITTKKRLCYD